MVNLIQYLMSNYNETLENIKNPIIDTWPLMGSPGPILCIISIYLIFVLKVGPKMMEKRPAFQLKTVMILYNAFQVLFSIWLTSLMLEIDIWQLYSSHGCNNAHHLPSLSHSQRENLQRTLLRNAWWYFFAKIIEFLDTVFFVLRKKQNQVTFLHVYHHTIVAIFSWCYLKLLPGEQGFIVGLLNSVVHIFMYSYYFIAALGSKYRKYLWWKKYMTSIQLIQFGIILLYLTLILALDCRTSKVLTYFFVTNALIFIYLFGNFYQKAYKTKKA